MNTIRPAVTASQTEKQKNPDLPNAAADVRCQVPSADLDKRAYHHPDYHISFRFRGDDWLCRVARARVLR
jgi:hypothetical protein